jgi:hypothetical protein
MKVGIDFTPDDPKFRTPGMETFAYDADQRVTSLIDAFVKQNWSGVGERRWALRGDGGCVRECVWVLVRVGDTCMWVNAEGPSGEAFTIVPFVT